MEANGTESELAAYNRLRSDSSDQISISSAGDVTPEWKMNKMMCCGCKLFFGLKYARISEILYQCLNNGEIEDFRW